MKKRNWKKYIFEFLSIFIAVISAFALNNWNDNRRNNQAENKILTEILNGLDKDLNDVAFNVNGHKKGISGCEFWRTVLSNKSVNLDSLQRHYYRLTGDFVSLQNISGYETLKSRGLELVTNDSLRLNIISLYEYEYTALKKFEEQHKEFQFYESYFHKFNNIIAPEFEYDLSGEISGIQLPLNISEEEKNLLLSYLWKIQFGREFIISYYQTVEEKINKLKSEIEEELKQ